MSLVVLFLVLTLVWVYKKTRKPRGFPPGPPRLPWVGSLPFLHGSGKNFSLLNGLTEQVGARWVSTSLEIGSTLQAQRATMLRRLRGTAPSSGSTTATPRPSCWRTTASSRRLSGRTVCRPGQVGNSPGFGDLLAHSVLFDVSSSPTLGHGPSGLSAHETHPPQRDISG